MNRIKTKIDSFMTCQLGSSIFSWQEILRMTVPYVLDSLSIMFIGMLITALISKNGEASVAAVSLVSPIGNLIVCLFNGICAGGTVVIAQCCGKKDTKLIRRAIGLIVWLTELVGIVTCLPFLLCPQQILVLLYPKAEALVLEKASVYLVGCAGSCLVFALYMGIFSVLRGLGESKKCLTLSVIINVAYLLFSILFLNWLNLDIHGSSYALLLARTVGAVCAVAALFFWRPSYPMTLRQVFSFDKRLLKSTLRVSLPFGAEQICTSLGAIVAGMYMTQLSTSALATHAIVNSLIGVLNSACMGAGSLAVTVVGRCIGAEEFNLARKYGKKCNIIALVLLGLSAILFYPLLPLLLRQYNPAPEAAALSIQLLWMSLPCLLLFYPMSSTLPNTLRAASDTLYPSVFSLAIMWACNIALGYLLAIPAGLGLVGVWIATWVSWGARTLAFSLRFQGSKWLYKTKSAALSAKTF